MVVVIDRLRGGVVLGEGLIVPMMMTTTIGPRLGLKDGLYRLNIDLWELPQHLKQNRVWLQLKIAGFNL
jgi:hypothetical protein